MTGEFLAGVGATLLDEIAKTRADGVKWDVTARKGDASRKATVEASWNKDGDDKSFTVSGNIGTGTEGKPAFRVENSDGMISLYADCQSAGWTVRIKRLLI